MIDWFAEKVAHVCTWFGFKVVCCLVQLFPGTTFRLADGLASVSFPLFRRFRIRSVDNIRAALGTSLDGPAITRIAQRSLRNFLRACIEIAVAVKASDARLRAEIAIEGFENLNGALSKGNGVLVLSAHLGNFFLVGCRLAIEGVPTYVLVNQRRDGRSGQLLDEYRLQMRHKTIHARPRYQALQELQTILRRNQVAVVIADEYRTGNGIKVPLLGRTVIARRGPVTLALRTGAAVVPACMIRQPDDTLKLVIEPELELERSRKGKAEITENTIRMTHWLERTVRKYPDQWNWMNIHWWESQNNDPIAEQHHERQAS